MRSPPNNSRKKLGPEAPIGRHKHPGEEIIYVLEGTHEYSIDGQAPTTFNAGDALMVPAETVHSVRNVGSGKAAELATYVVEKGKPFLVIVDERKKRDLGRRLRTRRDGVELVDEFFVVGEPVLGALGHHPLDQERERSRHLRGRFFWGRRLLAHLSGLGPPDAWLRAGSAAARDGATRYGVFISESDDKPQNGGIDGVPQRLLCG